MLYRENGQFKSTYRSDQQIFPILQDRIAMVALLVLAFVIVRSEEHTSELQSHNAISYAVFCL